MLTKAQIKERPRKKLLKVQHKVGFPEKYISALLHKDGKNIEEKIDPNQGRKKFRDPSKTRFA